MTLGIEGCRILDSGCVLMGTLLRLLVSPRHRHEIVRRLVAISACLLFHDRCFCVRDLRISVSHRRFRDTPDASSARGHAWSAAVNAWLSALEASSALSDASGETTIASEDTSDASLSPIDASVEGSAHLRNEPPHPRKKPAHLWCDDALLCLELQHARPRCLLLVPRLVLPWRRSTAECHKLTLA